MTKVESRPTPKVLPARSHDDDNARGRFMALAAALLGWMFDGAEMGIFSLVGKIAVEELMPKADAGTVGLWFERVIIAVRFSFLAR